MGRRSVRQALAGIPDEALGRIELLVSELITNSITHAALAQDETVDMRVLQRPDKVRIEVADPGAHFDPRAPRSPGAESNWGLFLLDQMADRWGMDPQDQGKTVWFEIDL